MMQGRKCEHDQNNVVIMSLRTSVNCTRIIWERKKKGTAPPCSLEMTANGGYHYLACADSVPCVRAKRSAQVLRIKPLQGI